MHGLMQDRPLDVSMLVRRVERLFAHKRVVTATASTSSFPQGAVVPRSAASS